MPTHRMVDTRSSFELYLNDPLNPPGTHSRSPSASSSTTTIPIGEKFVQSPLNYQRERYMEDNKILYVMVQYHLPFVDPEYTCSSN
jgi:hypothetical protein